VKAELRMADCSRISISDFRFQIWEDPNRLARLVKVMASYKKLRSRRAV